MGLPPVGSVVLLPFPFADFSGFKKRPGLIVAHAEFDNLVVCQITSKAKSSEKAINLRKNDFKTGELRLTSYIRPDKLFTIDPGLVQSILGELNSKKSAEVKQALLELFA